MPGNGRAAVERHDEHVPRSGFPLRQPAEELDELAGVVDALGRGAVGNRDRQEVAPVRCREQPLVLGQPRGREVREDAAPVVVEDDERERARAGRVARVEQAVGVVQEGDVADEQGGRSRRVRGAIGRASCRERVFITV